MALRALDLLTGPARFGGALSLHAQCGGVIPARLPARDLALMPGLFVGTVMMLSGVRLELVTDTGVLRVTGEQVAPQGAPPVYDLVVDGNLTATRSFSTAGRFELTFELPPGRKLVQVWFPVAAIACVHSVELEKAAFAEPPPARPRWLLYGSSITHCIDAPRPTEAWPTILALRHGLDIVNLGFSGNGHNDPPVARAIRDEPADGLLLEVGVNVVEQGSFNVRSFTPSLLGFIDTIRERHADAPIVVVSPIFQGALDPERGPTGMTLPGVRKSVAMLVDQLQRMGVGNVSHLDGRDLLGPDQADLLVRRHPTTEGNRFIADALDRAAFGAHGAYARALCGEKLA